METPWPARAEPTQVERALSVLLDAALEPIVDMVAWAPAPDHYEVASAHGHVRIRRPPVSPQNSGAAARTYDIERVSGENPIARQDPAHLAGLDAEQAVPHPSRGDNSYPHAGDQLAQLFDHPSAPDFVVQHSAAHYWADQGGHLGEHGSMGVVQARAPFIASGAGITRRGMVDDSCRLVDVAPTVLELLGCTAPSDAAPGQHLRRQDGAVLRDVVGPPGSARHVVAFLLDGTNANVLYAMAERGGVPNIARLMAQGATYRHGAMASLPTVTLANHTTALTGCHPGHHGILHNAWVDRRSGKQVVTNSPPCRGPRRHPGWLSVSVNEPCDVGADHSVFDLIRRGEDVGRPPPVDELPDATERFVRPSKDYRWSSRIDHTAVEQFVGIWSGEYRGRAWERPAFTWVNFTLTDAAFHEGGPYAEIAAAALSDTDARIGHVLAAVERAGVWDDTAFFVLADHGMELADPDVTGDWDAALAEAGVAARDEGYGFVYLTPA